MLNGEVILETFSHDYVYPHLSENSIVELNHIKMTSYFKLWIVAYCIF